MTTHPEIHIGDWIKIGLIDCVVSSVYPEDSTSGICKVIFNKQKPTTRDVDWNGENWFFPERPDFGGYAKGMDYLVLQLKRGR